MENIWVSYDTNNPVFNQPSITLLLDFLLYEVINSLMFKPLSNSFLLCNQVAPVVKSPPASVGDIRDMGSIPGLGRSPGGGHGNPLQ